MNYEESINYIKKISKFNIPLLVEYVNSDYTNIDIINR